VFSEDGGKIVSCPAGNKPESTGIVRSTEKCRASFNRRHCENCPHRDQCNPKISNKKAVVYVSKKQSERARAQRRMDTHMRAFAPHIMVCEEKIKPSWWRRKWTFLRRLKKRWLQSHPFL